MTSFPLYLTVGMTLTLNVLISVPVYKVAVHSKTLHTLRKAIIERYFFSRAGRNLVMLVILGLNWVLLLRLA